MYKIAICDDEKCTCSEIEEFLLDYAKMNFLKMDTSVFYTGQLLCRYLQNEEDFEVIFLDIELPDISGVTVGQFIRNTIQNESIHIVYISSKENYAMQLFQNRPLDFLIKPVTFEKIENVMKILEKKHELKKRYFECIVNKVHHRIFLSEILYFRSEDKKVNIHLREHKILTFAGKLKDVMEQLPEKQFCEIHKSYIINLNYVQEYSYEQVSLINHDMLSISKAKRNEVRRMLMYRK